MALKFLVADNDPKGTLLLGDYLQKEFSCTLDYVHTENDLLSRIEDSDISILFYDLSFPTSDQPLSTLAQLKDKFQHITILPLVPQSFTELIKDLLGLQLFFYLVKPLDKTELTITLRRALETILIQTPTDNSHIQSDTEDKAHFQGMIGSSQPMSQLFDIIERVAEDDVATVLIRGESGTGKEMVAKAIHQRSKRSNHNFVPVNCAAIPDELLESELFGYTKGAFTGATTNKQGRIQYADKGVLFLDEIGDMKPSLQAKLLRVLQEREFEPVGGFKTTPVDTRVLAATHCDLEKLVEQGQFREDLYYRLSVIPLTIPPLRERKDDIAPLISLFIDHYTTQRGRSPFSFSTESHKALIQHNWKGNVRELENLIQHMAVLYSGNTVEHHHLPLKFQLKEEITIASLATEQDNWSSPETAQLTSAFSSFNDERSALLSNSLPPIPEEPAPTELFSFQEDNALNTDNIGQFEENIETSTEKSVGNGLDITDFWAEGTVNFKELVDDFENQLIVKALRLADGNKKKAAELLNLKRTTLLEKIKKKGLQDSWE